MNVFQSLAVGLLCFLFSLFSFADYDKPQNLYELKKYLKLEINKDNIDIEKKMKISHLKLETDSIRFLLNQQPIVIQWNLVEDHVLLTINGRQLSQEIMSNDKKLNRELDKILSPTLTQRVLDLIIPQAFAHNNYRYSRQYRQRRGGLLEFFRNLFGRINRPSNRERVAQRDSGRRRGSCPYRPDGSYIPGMEPGYTPSPTPEPIADGSGEDIGFVATDTSGVDFLDGPIGSPNTVQQTRIVWVGQ